MSLGDEFKACAALNLDRVAVTDVGGQNWTYRALDCWSDGLAGLLSRAGATLGTVVGIRAERGVAAIVAMLAALKGGNPYVVIPSSLPESRQRNILEDADCSVIAADAARAVPGDVLIADGQSADPASPASVPDDTGAYLIYTSGSTGAPKGVLIEHRNVSALVQSAKELLRFTSTDSWSVFHSYGFDVSVWEILAPLLTGGRAVLVPDSATTDLDEFVRLLIDQRVTVLNQVPSIFAHLRRAHDRKGRPSLHVEKSVFAGEALPVSLVRDWPQAAGCPQMKMYNMYGITETTIHATCALVDPTEESESPHVPIGPALRHLELHVVDSELHAISGLGTGEILLTGDGLARGYWRRDDLTAERFICWTRPDGTAVRAYRSGDLAFRDRGGSMRWAGRIDDQVKIRGHRIELREIEAVLLTLKQVHEAAVFVDESSVGELLLHAVLVGPGDQQRLAGLAREHLRHLLPTYMIPSRYTAVPALPVNHNGKVDRPSLRTAAESRRANKER